MFRHIHLINFSLVKMLANYTFRVKSVLHQWQFQDPKMEVPTIYKAYFSGLCKRISPENMPLYGTVPPF